MESLLLSKNTLSNRQVVFGDSQGTTPTPPIIFSVFWPRLIGCMAFEVKAGIPILSSSVCGPSFYLLALSRSTCRPFRKEDVVQSLSHFHRQRKAFLITSHRRTLTSSAVSREVLWYTTSLLTRSRARSEARGSTSSHDMGGKAWKVILFQSGKVLASWRHGKHLAAIVSSLEKACIELKSYLPAKSRPSGFPVSRRLI